MASGQPVCTAGSKVKGPAPFGFVRPRLLLPQGLLEALSLDELQHVFLHELAHLRRRDIYTSWWAAVLQVLCWFNPLIWFAVRRMRVDQEMATDALALSIARFDEPRTYGRTIVNLLERFSGSQYLPSLAGVLETRSHIERMTMIARFHSTSSRSSLLGGLLTLVLALVVLPDVSQTKASMASASTPPTLRRIEVRPHGSQSEHSVPSFDGTYLIALGPGGNHTVRNLVTGEEHKLNKPGEGSMGVALMARTTRRLSTTGSRPQEVTGTFASWPVTARMIGCS